MPRGNGTGPLGRGRGSGRGMGYCAGTGAPGYASAPGRGGARCGYGRGMMARGQGAWMRRGSFGGGRGFGAWATPETPETERQDLQQQATFLENALATIKARLNALGAPKNQA